MYNVAQGMGWLDFLAIAKWINWATCKVKFSWIGPFHSVYKTHYS